MTEQARNVLIEQIEMAEDLEILERLTIPCCFYSERPTAELLQSVSHGYKLSKEYIWEPAYNLYGVHGGFNLIGFNYTLEELI